MVDWDLWLELRAELKVIQALQKEDIEAGKPTYQGFVERVITETDARVSPNIVREITVRLPTKIEPTKGQRLAKFIIEHPKHTVTR